TSSDPVYVGPVTTPPNLGPDPLDQHGQPRAARPNAEPGLNLRQIQELADWYKEETYRRYNDNTLDTPALDGDLRAKLAALGVSPRRLAVEFKRVTDVALNF